CHVTPIVGVTPKVGEPDSGLAEVLVLVVAADRGKTDPIVDLGDLVQRGGQVLGDEQHPTGVAEHSDTATPSDALAGELRTVAHHLLDRGIERHRHSGNSWVDIGSARKTRLASAAGLALAGVHYQFRHLTGLFV